MLDILNRFIDPLNKEPLKNDQRTSQLVAVDGVYTIKDGVIDFYTKTTVSVSSPLVAPVPYDAAPELRTSHEAAFEQAAQSGGNIYGSLDSLPAISQSGHYRRMKILADIDLGDIENKTAVDFGTGPWGFGCIFPSLRKAKECIGFDVSLTALEMARKVDSMSDFGDKVIFATSDGEVIPLADSSVDVFFGGEIIEHVRSPRQFLQEVSRVSRDDGMVILTTPNRDALLYRIADVQYCVGPEHIALLSYRELNALLDLFTVQIKVYGYETSLGPDLDHSPLDEGCCDLIQRRACQFPELSTGMISCSVVSKVKFLANRADCELKEAPYSAPSMAFKKPAPSLRLFGNVYGALLLADNELTIDVCATKVTLLFWGHDWSGFVEVIFGDVTVQRDLYSPTGGGFIRVDVEADSSAQFIRVKPLSKKREAAVADQVIFYKAIQYIAPSRH